MSETSRAIIAAIALVSLAGLGLSAMIPLLALEMERMGVSSTMNGMNAAVAGVANILIAPITPLLAGKIGVRRMIAGLILIDAAMILMFPLLPDFWAWCAIRFVFGAALGAMFILSEYWITVLAPPERRGLVMGVYASFLALGFAAGPVILSQAGTTGWPPYLITAALFLAALAPLALAPRSPPTLSSHGRVRLGPLIAAAPIATLAALIFGAVETGAFSQLPLYGLRIGLNEADAALLITWTMLGNLAFQIPIGWLSDRIDRRKVLFTCALFGVVGCAALPLVATMPWPQAILLFFWGGITGAIYTVGLAHLGSRFSGADMAQANAAFVMLYSFGLIAGPPYVGLGMDLAGSNGFPLTVSLLIACYAGLVGWRLARRQA